MKVNFKLKYIFIVLMFVFIAAGSLYLIFYQPMNGVPEKADLVFGQLVLEHTNG
ncbi:MAG: hypothetical protein ACLKAK_05445 [Alkaliphilus sp.]